MGIQAPKFCDLILLDACMLRCRMCAMWKSLPNPNPVPVRAYLRFIDSLAALSGRDMQIQFVGGEPLLRDGVLDMIAHASLRGFRTTMTTNGFLVDEKKALEIMAAGITTIVVSLDSIRPEVHDALRGVPGVFERARKALQYLHAARNPGQSIGVVATIMEPNLEDIVGLAEWAEQEEGIDAISFQAVDQPFGTPPVDAWHTRPEFEELWPKDSAEAGRVIDRLIELRKPGSKITNSKNQLASFKRYFEMPGRFIKRGACHLGYDALSVSPAGDVFLCFDQPAIGNMRQSGVEAMWDTPQAENVRAQIKECRRNCKMMMNCFAEEGFSHER